MDQVDAAILSNVVHQIPVAEREPVLAACHRMLRPGGRCALNTLYYAGAIVPSTCYARWIYETDVWLTSRGSGIVFSRPKPIALRTFTAERHGDLLRRAGFADVHVEEISYDWTVEDWEALASYSAFVEGATGLSAVALGSDALKAALRTTFAALKLQSLPRRWLFASASRAA